MAGFRLGVRQRPLNKSGGRLHPQGAFESVGGAPGGLNDTAGEAKTKGSGPGEEEHPTGVPGMSLTSKRRATPPGAGSPSKILEKLLDM